MEKKIHLAQLNDINGNFILFKLIPSTTEEMASISESEFKERFRKKEKIVNELENIDLEAKFFQLNTTSTTFSIAVKEAVANANSELTRQISHDGQPMKVSRAKNVL
jgi:tyrosyl-tRNA synthetase